AHLEPRGPRAQPGLPAGDRARHRVLTVRGGLDDDRGSAVVEFVLVSGMLVLLVLAVLQLGLALHVRNALIAAAGEGARFAALADTGPEEGADRTRELVTASLGAGYE